MTPAVLVAALLAVAPTAGAGNLIRPDGTVDWTRYHDSDEAAGLLQELAANFPNLARVTKIGRSFQGKDLLVLEVTNQSRPGAEKPGYYVDGGVHSGELAGSEQVLYLAWHLCTRYGNDPEITRLLDRRVLYLRPKFNPDGSDHALKHADGLRSTVRPWDEDEDGRLDEDPAEDLDGDRAITTMRVKSPHGTHEASAEDPRLLVPRAAAGRGPYYLLVPEGIDNDGDGEINEDGVGGIDMNRNFPRTWGLPYLQPGAGPYPLSEPEARATLEFLAGHPNVTGLVHNHTAGGFLFRLPSTDPPSAHEPEDLELVALYGERYTAVTGHPVRDSYTSESQHRYGTLISWAYFDYGVLGWVPEHWGGFGRDYDGDGKVSERERLRWNDEELGGAGFTPWKEYAHPQLGTVEIGGWKRRFTEQNPPGRFLEQEIAMKVPWFVSMASASPLIRIAEARATPLGGGLFRVDVAVENEGELPTNVTKRALKANLAKPVRVELELKDAQRVEGAERAPLGHIPGTRALRGSTAFDGAAPAANRRTVSWVVKAAAGGRATITVASEKGGTDRRTIPLR